MEVGAGSDSPTRVDTRMVDKEERGPHAIGAHTIGAQPPDSQVEASLGDGVRSKWSVLGERNAGDLNASAAVPSSDPTEMALPIPPTNTAPDAPMVRLDEDVQFTSLQVGGVSMVRCIHAGTGQHFQFGPAEHHVAELLDGKRSVTEVVAEAENAGLDWNAQDVADFIGVLVSQKLATTYKPTAQPPAAFNESANTEASRATEGATDEARNDQLDSLFDSEAASSPIDSTVDQPSANPSVNPSAPQSPSKLQGYLTTLLKVCSYAISLRFPLITGQPWAATLTPKLRPLLVARGASLVVGGIVVSLLFAWLHSAALSREFTQIFDSKQWIVMLVAWAVLKLIHELGHACVAHHHGVRVGRAGIMFFMFAPLAYVDVTDAWKLPKRTSRMVIALGGVYFELICASVAIWTWWWFQGGWVGNLAAQIFFIAGPATLLVNANPLLRLDGYYVVSDLVDIPNLRDQGRRLLGGLIESRLFLMKQPQTHLNGWRRGFAGWHAAASILFQIVWMGGLVIVVSMWAGPLGLLIAGCALLLWTIVPTVKWFHRLWFYEDTDDEFFSKGSHRRRLMWTVLTIFAVLQFVMTLPSPLMVKIPVVARFSNDQVLRAPTSGFVRQVNFTSGQFVRAGEVILHIENNELELERDKIRLELEAEAIHWQRNERQSSLGLAEASLRRSESLKRKLAEIEEQLDSMQIKTPVDGEILTPRLDELKNRYVHHGTELIQIGSRNSKEILVSIGEDEIDQYESAAQQNGPLRVCFRGGQWIDVKATAILPRGSREVPHPAMAATAGGPLAVTAKQDDQQGSGVELLTPRFEAIVPIPPGKSDLVRCGEVGYLGLQDKRTLARRFWVWFKGDTDR